MRAAVLFVGLTACGFSHGQLPDAGGGDGGGSDDAQACAWSYTPTNFDPCKLPAPVGLTVSTDDTIDTDATTLPKLAIVQSDGTTITVIHLSELSVSPLAMLTVNGTGVVFAVDGTADIDGRITVVGGSDNDTHCATSRGQTGTDSQDITGGAGGGGGGAAADDGADGGDGAGIDAGAKGAKGAKVQSSLSPLRGGCRGGNGGRVGTQGQAALGGRGGGALQISTNTKIAVAGMLDAAGRGGEGGTAAHVGGGGGGSGGGILLEGPEIELGFASRVCADGGSGGEGGGVTVEGKDGERGACTSIAPARTATTQNSAGGGGGEGGFLVTPAGRPGEVATSSGGGGGGGGGVGWIVIKSPKLDNQGAAITPAAVE